METGLVDLMHNPAVYGAIKCGFSDVAPDFTVTNHKLWVDSTLVNLTWWNSLPEDIQDLIDGAWRDAAAANKWAVWTAHISGLEEIQQPPYNMNVYYPTAEEMAEFKAAVMPVYDWAREEYGDDKVDMMLDYAK